MAFAVAHGQEINADIWTDFFGQWAGNGVPWLAIKNWVTDGINYAHAQKLDMFGTGTGAGSAPGGAAAWVA
jgi:hypothetical protein